MKLASQIPQPRIQAVSGAAFVLNASPDLSCLAIGRRALMLLPLIVVSLWCANAAAAAPPQLSGSEELPPEEALFLREKTHHQAVELQEHFRVRVSIQDAVKTIPKSNVVGSNPGSRFHATEAVGLDWYVWVGVFLCVPLLLNVRRIALACSNSDPKNPTESEPLPILPEGISLQEQQEHLELWAFLQAFKEGPQPIPQAGLPSDLPEVKPSVDGATTNASKAAASSIEHLFAKGPERLMVVRNLLHELGLGAEEHTLARLLGDVCGELRSVKSMASLPQLRPVWQMAYLLESYLRQLHAQPSKVTPSALRTATIAVDVLQGLFQAGLNPNFCTNPPPQVLAISDSGLIPDAVSFGLKHTLRQPDVAAPGEAALALTGQNPYAVIFLEVEAPFEDGFQLCSRIRQSPLNRNTPIVFVTGHDGFEALAESSVVSETDFLGKPYLAFEILVKALTIAARARLQARCEAGTGYDQSASISPVRALSDSFATHA
jgi:CheY-like chemotaxis protein